MWLLVDHLGHAAAIHDADADGPQVQLMLQLGQQAVGLGRFILNDCAEVIHAGMVHGCQAVAVVEELKAFLHLGLPAPEEAVVLCACFYHANLCRAPCRWTPPRP